jgi:transcriptional regulator with XRE-family HTH domain
MPSPQSEQHAALGRAIRRLPVDRGVSQEKLAHRSGLDRSYMGGVERGERNLGLANLIKIAGALEVGPSELLAEAEREF